MEAKIGGRMFGVTQKNVRREFFCLDPHTWVWHEEWTDNYGKRQIVTTRYNLRPEGIIKAHNNQHYEKVGKEDIYWPGGDQVEVGEGARLWTG